MRYAWIASVAVLCLIPGGVGSAGAASEIKSGKPKKPVAAHHAAKHRRSAAATAGFRYQGGVPVGPLYNGQDYLGDDPDPNVRSYLIRDMIRYGGTD